MCVFEGALENSRVWSYIEVYVKSLWNQKALGKSFNLPEPQFPHLQSGEITVSGGRWLLPYRQSLFRWGSLPFSGFQIPHLYEGSSDSGPSAEKYKLQSASDTLAGCSWTVLGSRSGSTSDLWSPGHILSLILCLCFSLCQT